MESASGDFLFIIDDTTSLYAWNWRLKTFVCKQAIETRLVAVSSSSSTVPLANHHRVRAGVGIRQWYDCAVGVRRDSQSRRRASAGAPVGGVGGGSYWWSVPTRWRCENVGRL